MKEKFVIGALVENRFGVLNRVAALFSKRNYNIDSLAVGETEHSAYSRMTIVVSGDDYIRDQIVKQLEKLYDVKEIAILEHENAHWREHLLIKFRFEKDNRALTEFINGYGGMVLDIDAESLTAEFTGKTHTSSQFIEEAKKLGILEMCRSGVISLARGTDKVMNVNKIENH